MDTLIAAFIAVAVTLFFVRGYLKQLTAPQQTRPAGPRGDAVAAPAEARPCPRCNCSIAKGTAFCPHCGAALAMWSIHSAAVQSVAVEGGAKGKLQPVINASMCVGCGSCVDECPETGTLALSGGKAILAHPERCVGHGKCAAVCPTSAITLAAEGILQTVKVPFVKENFETNVPGVFIVGELAGMGLIKTAINEGKLVIDHLKQRFETANSGSPGGDYDVVIVGAGPAGLSATLAAHQYGMRYLTLEQGEIAATIRQYPRHKFLMAEPIDLPLYGTLYVADGTKEALLSVWETILSNTGVRVATNERVQQVLRNGSGFQVPTAKGRYSTRQVVLAMGKRGVPRRLEVRGEELSKVCYRLIEAETYKNEDLLVVGGGDSAIEAALALSRSASNRVTLSYRGDNFRRARERNCAFLEEAEQSGRVSIKRNSRVLEIRPDSVTLDVEGRAVDLPNHYTFVLIGGESPEEFLRRTGVEIVEKVLTA
ncbi:MAG TPA: NAD(P)-binding domain-containing protein [Terriglobia bacterium]|nr:NAD(P)-binding domain-containing protein [Terriglobia bacterium]